MTKRDLERIDRLGRHAATLLSELAKLKAEAQRCIERKAVAPRRRAA